MEMVQVQNHSLSVKMISTCLTQGPVVSNMEQETAREDQGSCTEVFRLHPRL